MTQGVYELHELLIHLLQTVWLYDHCLCTATATPRANNLDLLVKLHEWSRSNILLHNRKCPSLVDKGMVSKAEESFTNQQLAKWNSKVCGAEEAYSGHTREYAGYHGRVWEGSLWELRSVSLCFSSTPGSLWELRSASHCFNSTPRSLLEFRSVLLCFNSTPIWNQT